MQFLNKDFYSLKEDPHKYEDNYEKGIGCTLRNFLLLHCIRTISNMKKRIRLNDEVLKRSPLAQEDL